MALLLAPEVDAQRLALRSEAPAALRLEADTALLSGDSSDELEGGSPTSQRSGVHLALGQHGDGAARVVPPRRKVLRWLLGQVGQRKQAQLDLPSGGSFDSLQSLDAQQQDQEQQDEQQDEQPQQNVLRRFAKGVLRPVVHLVRALAAGGPAGPGNNDNSAAEKIVNVVTSLPFFAVGLHGLRRRRCPRARQFSLGFMAVGVVAAAYHGADTRSRARLLWRKADYWTIAAASNLLRRAAHIPLPRAAAVAAAVVAPIKPTAVTALNLGLVEAKYLRAALAHAHLRKQFRLHVSTSLAGLACFAFEDVATAWGVPPVLHSLWHCLSAMAMGCTNALLHHQELALLVEGVQVRACAA